MVTKRCWKGLIWTTTRGIAWNEAFWTWTLPLCSGDGVSLGNSDRNTPTSSRALVTTGSLALKSLLKPCDNTHIHKHKIFRIIVVRFNMSFAMVPICSVNILLTLIQYNTFLSSVVNLICNEELVHLLLKVLYHFMLYITFLIEKLELKVKHFINISLL